MSFLRSSLFTALTAVSLLSHTATVQAQTDIVAAGHGRYLPPNSPTETSFTFSCVELPTGAVSGFGVWTGANATVLLEITSAMHLPAPYEGSVGMAGTIAAIVGTPDPRFFFTLGNTVYFAVKDGGGSGPDLNAGLSGWPPFLPPLKTIQQIVSFAQANNMYQIAWRTLLSGFIWVR